MPDRLCFLSLCSLPAGDETGGRPLGCEATAFSGCRLSGQQLKDLFPRAREVAQMVCTPSSDAQPDTVARVCGSVSSAFLW